MKKSRLLIAPLLVVPFLASCGGGSEEYKVSIPDTNGVIVTPNKATKGKEYVGTIKMAQDVDPDHILPDALDKVTSGNKELAATKDYTYTLKEDKLSADFKIPAANIVGDVSVQLTLKDKPDPTTQHTLTFAGHDCELYLDSGYKTKFVDGKYDEGPFNGYFKPSTDFEYPTDANVKLTSGQTPYTSYTYDASTGHIAFTVDADINIDATSESNLVNINVDTTKMSIVPATGFKNTDYSGVITLNETGVALDVADIEITVGEEKLVYGNDFKVEFKGKNADNKFEYNLDINAEMVTNNVSINVEAKPGSMFEIIDKDQDGAKDGDLATAFEFSGVTNLNIYTYPVDHFYNSESSNVIYLNNLFYNKRSMFTNSQIEITADEGGTIYDYKLDGQNTLFYRSESMEQSVPTPADEDLSMLLTSYVFPYCTIDDPQSVDKDYIPFSNDTLSYKTNKEIQIEMEPIPGYNVTITVRSLEMSFYDNKPMKITLDMEVTMLGQTMGAKGVYEYNYKVEDDLINIPTEDEYYESSGIDYSIDPDATIWDTCLSGFDYNTPFKVATTDESGDDIDECFDNDKTVIKHYTTSGLVDSVYGYFQDREDGKYYRFAEDTDGELYRDREADEDEYLKYCGKPIVDLINACIGQFDKFEYSFGEYCNTETILGYEAGAIGITMNKYTSASENVVTYEINALNLYGDETIAYHQFERYGFIHHIELPDFPPLPQNN